MKRFVSEALAPVEHAFDPADLGRGIPSLPHAFQWRAERLTVTECLRAWRSTKEDRGDAYLAKFWFEIRLAGGRTATVYFDRKARGTAPRWWLYAIDELEAP